MGRPPPIMNSRTPPAADPAPANPGKEAGAGK